MKLLHTSDWHIGRALYGKKRYEEFEAFLNWLIQIINRESIDLLLVSGDVFDTTTPGNRSQELYYGFLCRVAASCCSHVVVIAGNHDSPSFLNAPGKLLRALNVYVIGSIAENCEDEILVLKNKDGIPELIVCAVPHLRDRDIRLAEPGESTEEKEQKLIDGIRMHYFDVCRLAQHKREELNKEIPLIVMGHLFAAGGQTVDGDGVRELYVGSLAHVSAGIFPEYVDYLALGHLHIPQIVNGSDLMRYSGSPLPMSFGEARQRKTVSLAEFSGRSPSVSTIDIPVFQRLESIRGSREQIENRLKELLEEGDSVWLEIAYEGDEIAGNLRERLEELVCGSRLEILRVKDCRVINRILNQDFREESLDDLSVNEVFERCLDLNKVPPEQRTELLGAYQEILLSLYEEIEEVESGEAGDPPDSLTMGVLS